ncbi:MAG: flagellar basal-body MS-ring/collar protein FliF [Bacillota bacterium]
MAGDKGVSLEIVQERWQALGKTRQLVIVIIAAALIVSILLVVLTPPKTEYVTLYSNLDAAQASPLVQYLRERGVEFRLDDFGATLKVPANMADELRIEMAGKGMPFAQGLGFEIFDEDQFGITDFERQVKLQRALQEELRRTITSLDAVMQARVHLAIPEPRVFMKERTSPSAAIYLKLNPFVPLKEEQVRGIVFLVASSVEDLKPENIVLIDSQGNILYDAASSVDPVSALADSTLKQLEVKRAFEMELERRVQHMLERVFGPGKVLALITAKMDFDVRETTVITYDEQGVPRSTQVIEERFEGTGPVMGEVGEANYPGYVGVTPGGESTYERREETVNYEISESSERVVAAPGKLLNLHTSVVVDTGKTTVTEEQIEQVNRLVASAIGYDAARGDQISVQGMSFDTTFVDEMEAALAGLDLERRRNEMFQLAVLGAATLFFLILMISALRRRRRMRERLLIPAGEGARLDELLAAGMAFEEEVVIPDLTPGETPLGRARKLVEENPDVAIFVLRSWMVEES